MTLPDHNPYTRDPATTEDRAAIPLSVPHLTGTEMAALSRAMGSNWLGPIGPDVAAFEEEFAEMVGSPHALATTSGTAALHLALRVLGVGPGDQVLVSTFTFCASVNPIIYVGAEPVFVDSERASWNMDPRLLADELERRGRAGELPAAVIVVHLFGQMADMSPLLAACDAWGVPVIEDAAEALGACHLDGPDAGRAAGTIGRMGIFSFDASKIITTSMGGMLVSRTEAPLEHARKLARQAREAAPHYEHTEIGYNYRMSNLLAALGREQLKALPDRVRARREVFDRYREGLGHLRGIELQPEASWTTHTRWLSCLLVDPDRTSVTREELHERLVDEGIETRPTWKPMHLQPVYRDLGLHCIEGRVAEDLFERGLCLPSSSSMTSDQIDRVCEVIRDTVNDG